MTEPGISTTAIRMLVQSIFVDPSSNNPIVILRDEEERLFLPIWIGAPEARAILESIEDVRPARPMTHDLLCSSIEQLGAEVERIVVSELRDDTFYAVVYLERGDDSPVEVDARPSDAIALALRAEAPIYVETEVLEKAKADQIVVQASDEEKLRKWLEELNPEDLGKYTM